MKLSRLFKKIEEFFSLDEQVRAKKTKKIKKLSSNLAEKIECKKEKIQDATNKRKKEKMKKELEILIKLEKKLDKE